MLFLFIFFTVLQSAISDVHAQVAVRGLSGHRVTKTKPLALHPKSVMRHSKVSITRTKHPVNVKPAALPTKPVISHGKVNITRNKDSMNVKMSSAKGIINWQSFNIAQNKHVIFQQPPNSVVLNRVVGSTPSSIAGRLQSDGRVILVNPNGIAITKTGVIRAKSFIASTLNIKNDDFLNNTYAFQDEFGQYRYITNEGKVHAYGGFVALLGGAVHNKGTIVSSIDRVAIGSGKRVALDISGDNFLQVLLPIDSSGTVVDSEGNKLNNIVNNKGIIAGQSVHISAEHAKNALYNVVNLSGHVRFNNVKHENGKLILSSNGNVSIASDAIISSTNNNGTLAINADKVEIAGAINLQGRDSAVYIRSKLFDLFGSVRVNDISNSGAGRVDVRSDNINVYPDSLIEAKSLFHKGGRVVLFGTGLLDFQGTIDVRSAKGEGFIDLSAKNVSDLPLNWIKNLNLQHGVKLLIDPKKILIVGNKWRRNRARLANLVGSRHAHDNLEVRHDHNDNVSHMLKIHKSSIIEALNAGADVTLQANDLIHGLVNIHVKNRSAGHLTLQSGGHIKWRKNRHIHTMGDVTLIANANNADGVISSERNPGNAFINFEQSNIFAKNLRVELKRGIGRGARHSYAANIVFKDIRAHDVYIKHHGARAQNGTVGWLILHGLVDTRWGNNGRQYYEGKLSIRRQNVDFIVGNNGSFELNGSIRGSIHGTHFLVRKLNNERLLQGNFINRDAQIINLHIADQQIVYGSAVPVLYNNPAVIDQLRINYDVGHINDVGEYNYTLDQHNLDINRGYFVDLRQNRGTLRITPKALTVSGLLVSGKSYDGLDVATVTNWGSLTTGVGSETITLGAGTARFTDVNAGERSVTIVPSYSYGGGAVAENYAITLPSVQAIITPKALTVSGLLVSGKSYDGLDVATVTNWGSLTTGVGSETITLGAGTARFTDVNAGERSVTIVPSYSYGGGAVAENYAITLPSVQAIITPKALTVSGLLVSGKSYDGLDVATVTNWGSLTTGVGSETITLGAGTARFTDVNAGERSVTIVPSYSYGGGAVAENYAITLPSVQAIITPKALTVSGLLVSGKSYDGLDVATVTNWGSLTTGVGSETITLGAGTARFTDVNAGERSVTIVPSYSYGGGAVAENYAITLPSVQAIITPKALTVSGLRAEKSYDGDSSILLSGSLEGVVGTNDVYTGIHENIVNLGGSPETLANNIDITHTTNDVDSVYSNDVVTTDTSDSNLHNTSHLLDNSLEKIIDSEIYARSGLDKILHSKENDYGINEESETTDKIQLDDKS